MGGSFRMRVMSVGKATTARRKCQFFRSQVVNLNPGLAKSYLISIEFFKAVESSAISINMWYRTL